MRFMKFIGGSGKLSLKLNRVVRHTTHQMPTTSAAIEFLKLFEFEGVVSVTLYEKQRFAAQKEASFGSVQEYTDSRKQFTVWLDALQSLLHATDAFSVEKIVVVVASATGLFEYECTWDQKTLAIRGRFQRERMAEPLLAFCESYGLVCILNPEPIR